MRSDEGFCPSGAQVLLGESGFGGVQFDPDISPERTEAVVDVPHDIPHPDTKSLHISVSILSFFHLDLNTNI